MKSRARLVLGLAALAALFLAPLAEASLTRSTSPAIERPALTLTAPTPGLSEFSLFEGTELAAAAAGSERPKGFHPLAAVSLFSKDGAEAPLVSADEASYPKTRIRGLRLFSQKVYLVERELSLEVHWGCADFSCGLTSGTVGWLSQDPLGDQDSVNLYGYVGMRPHEKTDPLGLCEECVLLHDQVLEQQGRDEEAARRRGPTISAIEGNRLRGALYWTADTLLPFGLSEERANYKPLYGAGQAPADLRAFKRSYSKEIFAVDAAMALKSPGTAMKAVGILGAVAGLQEREGTPGTSNVLRNEERLDASGRHVVNEVTRMSKEAEGLVEAGSGTSAEAARYAKYKESWFGFFFRGRAIQSETEKLLQAAFVTDPTLAAVQIRPRLGGLVPDFVYTQKTGEQVILDVTSPRSSTYQKILKYARTGEEILVEIYHEGRGLQKK